MKVILQDQEILIKDKLEFENLLDVTSIRSIESTSNLQTEILRQLGPNIIIYINCYSDILNS